MSQIDSNSDSSKPDFAIHNSTSSVTTAGKPGETDLKRVGMSAMKDTLNQLLELENAVAPLLNLAHQIQIATEGVREVDLESAQIELVQQDLDSLIGEYERQVVCSTDNNRLNGSLEIQHTASSLSPVLACQIQRVALCDGQDKQFHLEVLNSASPATIRLSSILFRDGLRDGVTIQLAGSEGSETFSFQQGATANQIAESINLFMDSTGIVAQVFSGILTLKTQQFGEEAFIDLSVLVEPPRGRFRDHIPNTRIYGSDIEARINGLPATGTGNSLHLVTSKLDVWMAIEPSFVGQLTFSTTGGGLEMTEEIRLGVSSLLPSQFGGPSGRLYEICDGQIKSLRKNLLAAKRIARESFQRLQRLRTQLHDARSSLLEEVMVGGSPIAPPSNRVDRSSAIGSKLERSKLSLLQPQLVQAGDSVLSIQQDDDLFWRR